MRLTSYGKKELAAVLFAGLLSIPLLILVAPYLIIIPLLFMGFVLYFFRDPNRIVPEEPNVFVAPADGKVVAVDEVTEELYFNGPVRRICIFLSLTNVHINRVPFEGTVEKIIYTPGKFLNALRERASTENENNLIGFRAPQGFCFGVKQISGTIARRIVCRLENGDQPKAGEKFGMIKFGSRTEIYFPEEEKIEILIHKGDKVVAGETLIARYIG